MRIYEGLVREIGWQDGQERTAWIECPGAASPAAGRYVMAWSPEQPDAPLATSLFAARIEPQGFLAAPPIPATWEPGTALQLRGPLGRGFSPPGPVRRLALAGLGDGLARLQPLLQDALEKGAAVALFADQAPPGLPSAVEVNPLETLDEALAWADYLALDLPASELPGLAHRLGVERGLRHLPCPAQALVGLPLPCGGLADCGACAVETRRGWKLACQDGPVFDLIDLLPRM
jgi:NAD(P)H-flavin reductase